MSSRVGRSVLIYGIAFAAVGVTPFLLLPILTQRLTPQQFGEVTSFLMLAALLGNLAGLSAHGYASVRFFKLASEPFRHLVSSSVVAMAAAHALAAGAVILLAPVLMRLLELPLGYLLLAVPAALFVNLNLLFLAIFQSSGQPMLYLQARLVQGVAEFMLCLALVFLLVPDAGSRIYSYTAAIAASALVGAAHVVRRQQIGGRVERAHWRGLLAFGLPMLPHIVAGSAITYLDRLVVATLLGAQSLGIYMVAMQVGMAMIALIEPLNKALAPWLFGALAQADAAARKRIVVRTYQLYAALVAVGVLVASAAHLLFDRLIGAQFADAKALIPCMVAGFVLQGMYYTVVNYLFYAERTGHLSMVSGSTACIGVGVSYLLTSYFGLQGAGVSFVVNNALLFLLAWFMAAKAVPMPWRLGR